MCTIIRPVASRQGAFWCDEGKAGPSDDGSPKTFPANMCTYVTGEHPMQSSDILSRTYKSKSVLLQDKLPPNPTGQRSENSRLNQQLNSAPKSQPEMFSLHHKAGLISPSFHNSSLYRQQRSQEADLRRNPTPASIFGSARTKGTSDG